MNNNTRPATPCRRRRRNAHPTTSLRAGVVLGALVAVAPAAAGYTGLSSGDGVLVEVHFDGPVEADVWLADKSEPTTYETTLAPRPDGTWQGCFTQLWPDNAGPCFRFAANDDDPCTDQKSRWTETDECVRGILEPMRLNPEPCFYVQAAHEFREQCWESTGPLQGIDLAGD